MNAIQRFFQAGVLEASWAERIGWTLLHSLWQLVLIAGVYALVVAMLRKRSAKARYLCGCVALMAMIGVPVGSYLLMPGGNGSGVRRPEVAPVVMEFTEPAPAAFPVPDVAPPMVEVAAEPAAILPAPEVVSEPVAVPESAPVTILSSTTLRPWLPWATAVWLLGVCFLSLRPILGWLHIRRLQRHGISPLSDSLRRQAGVLARRLGVTRAVEFVQSTLVEVPTVVGSLRPFVLLPASAVTGLSVAQIEMILAHELAHIRRHDYLVNLAQTVVEALLFFHPAMWWVSRQVRKERENCCDDIAVAVSGNREHYVQALTRLEEQRAASSVAVLAATGGSLLERVRRLLGQPCAEFGYRSAAAWLAGLVAVGFVSLALATGDAPQQEGGEVSAGDVEDRETVAVETEHEAMLSYARALAAGNFDALEQTWEFQDDLDRRFAEKLAGMFARAEAMTVDLVSMQPMGEDSLFACFLMRNGPEQSGSDAVPSFTTFHRKDGRWRCAPPQNLRTMINARTMGAEQLGRRAIARQMVAARFNPEYMTNHMAYTKAQRDAFARLARPPYKLDHFGRIAEQMTASLAKMEAMKPLPGKELWCLTLDEHGMDVLPRPGDFNLSFYLPADPADPHARKLPFPGREKTFLAEPCPCLTDDAVCEASVGVTPGTDAPRIELRFTSGGARLLEAITRESIKQRLAIVIDGKVISAPQIMGTIDNGKVTIEGSFTRQEADAIVGKLNSYRRDALKLIEEVGKGLDGGDEGAGEDPAGDVQVVLHADKPEWPAGELPRFSTEVRQGDKKIVFGWGEATCELEFDGAWYELHVDDHRVDQITLEEAWRMKGANRGLPLAPGAHTVRVAINGPIGGKSVRMVSNPVEIRVADSNATPSITVKELRQAMLGVPVCAALCEATGDARAESEGKTPFVLQDFRIIDVLAGFDLSKHIALRGLSEKPKEGDRAKVIRVHHSSHALRGLSADPKQGDRVICVLHPRFDGVEGAKLILPDTPANRAAVAALAGERQRLDVELIRQRTKQIENQIERFQFTVRWYHGPDEDYPMRKSRIFKFGDITKMKIEDIPENTILLSAVQIRRLIKHLGTEGFMLWSLSTLGKDIPPPSSQSYTFTLHGPEEVELYEVLGGDSVSRRLSAMVKAFKVDSGKEMKLPEKSLKSLAEPYLPGHKVDLGTIPADYQQQYPNEKKWGEAVDDVRVRLHSPRAQWDDNQWTLFFKTDLESKMERVLPHYGAPIDEFFLEFDGEWFEEKDRGAVIARSVAPSPARQRRDLHTRICAREWRSMATGLPMPEFAPGRHTVRIGFPLADEPDASGQRLRAVSNPVEIVTATKEVGETTIELRKCLAKIVKRIGELKGRYPELAELDDVKLGGSIVASRKNPLHLGFQYNHKFDGWDENKQPKVGEDGCHVSVWLVSPDHPDAMMTTVPLPRFGKLEARYIVVAGEGERAGKFREAVTAVIKEELENLRDGSSEVPWGKASQGVQARLTEVKGYWSSRSDWPHPLLGLSYEVKNEGSYILQLPENGLDHQVEVDGQWYEWVDPPREVEEAGEKHVSKRGGTLLDFGPGGQHAGQKIEAAGNWRAIPKGREDDYAARRYAGWAGGRDDDYGTELVLTPRRHQVRVAVVCPSARAPFHGVIRAVSNAMEAKIIASKEQSAVEHSENAFFVAKVVDADTGEPIEKLTALAGTSRMEDIGWQWQPHTIHEFAKGRMQWPPASRRGYELQVLRIEADGYKPYQTPVIRRLEDDEVILPAGATTGPDGGANPDMLQGRVGEPVTWVVRLQRDPGVQGRALLSNGQPASGAQVAIAMAAREVRIGDGRITVPTLDENASLRDHWDRPFMTTTDDQGRFALPTEIAPAAVIITHAQGIAAIPLADFPISGEMTLEPWGAIDGRVQWGEASGAGARIDIGARSRVAEQFQLVVWNHQSVVTDDQGRFHAEKLPPGFAQVSHVVELPGKERSSYRPVQFVEIAAGEPTEFVLGGRGRPVIGKLVGRKSYENVKLRIAPEAPYAGLLSAPDDPDWEAYSKFQNSPAGKHYVKSGIRVNADGTFRIENVPPERYQLFVTAPNDGNIGNAKFTIKTIPGGESDQAQDLGEIKLAPGAELEERATKQASEGAPATSDYRRGQAEAEADLKAGRARYFHIGLPLSADSQLADILLKDYGLTLVGLGCVPVPPVGEHAKGYNETVVRELGQKFGRDLIKKAWEKDGALRDKARKSQPSSATPRPMPH